MDCVEARLKVNNISDKIMFSQFNKKYPFIYSYIGEDPKLEMEPGDEDETCDEIKHLVTHILGHIENNDLYIDQFHTCKKFRGRYNALILFTYFLYNVELNYPDIKTIILEDTTDNWCEREDCHDPEKLKEIIYKNIYYKLGFKVYNTKTQEYTSDWMKEGNYLGDYYKSDFQDILNNARKLIGC